MGRIFETRKATMFARWNKMAKVFTRISKDIAIAVKAAGPNPKDNSALRRALQNARGANMPKDKVEAAIKRASGQDQQAYEVVLYEGYGPGGVAVLCEIRTDNRNRTAADLRLAFSKHGGNLGETGCVSYLFEQRSVVRLEAGDLPEEALLERLLELEEAGGPAVVGYNLDREGADVLAAYADLEALQDGLRGLGLPVAGWEHRWIAPLPCRLDSEDTLRPCLRMLDALEDLDDVRSVTSNLEADEDLLIAVME
ncbi:MAG: YebC/PmpR family DNA-binding transcriptional regulator [Cyanobium sp. ELA712]